ncbi:alpha/beta hydrolase [Streptomyces sp. WZ-12]|uniref:alpha/beta hydrolase n=1 Tax=Streptomyces sp. WZ-12 TaxID=3030210 RepID=UPI002380C58D|nr:alpha/beta hydrolase-fold protein [Streptomyces sp. WZ-12]
MNSQPKAVLRSRAVELVALVALFTAMLGPSAPTARAAPAAGAVPVERVAPVARAATVPPHFADGFGLTVVSQPKWVGKRTFVLTVKSTEVPVYDAMQGQVSGQHVLMVTVPTGYNGAAATRYPALYMLHGAPERPNALRYLNLLERATQGRPLITVTPNGGGRGWYTNWVNPGSRGRQNWESFHLDQVIPFIDANLRTIPSRAGRAIVGHSMGGFGAFHYAEDRPDLFSYVGSFSGDLDLDDPVMRAAVVGSSLLPSFGTPLEKPGTIFGPPVWPLDAGWNKASPAQHVGALRGMGVAMYTGNGGNLTVDPVLALAEKEVEQTTLRAAANLRAAGIPYHLVDYGNGSAWAAGCNGKHSQDACLRADINDYVSLIMKRLQHP